MGTILLSYSVNFLYSQYRTIKRHSFHIPTRLRMIKGYWFGSLLPKFYTRHPSWDLGNLHMKQWVRILFMWTVLPLLNFHRVLVSWHFHGVSWHFPPCMGANYFITVLVNVLISCYNDTVPHLQSNKAILLCVQWGYWDHDHYHRIEEAG